MKAYIFLTPEGYTFQSNSESAEPDIENLQVIGFAHGNDERDAFERLLKENPYILETTFNELIALELKNAPEKGKTFYISEKRCES